MVMNIQLNVIIVKELCYIRVFPNGKISHACNIIIIRE